MSEIEHTDSSERVSVVATSLSSDDNSQVVQVVKTAKNRKDKELRVDFSNDFTTSVAAQAHGNHKKLLGKGKVTIETSFEDEEGLGISRMPYRSRMPGPIKRSKTTVRPD